MDARARAFVSEVRRGEPTATLSNRLGYRGDTVSDWEAGKKVPAAEEVLRFCSARGVDVFAAFQRFDAATGSALATLDTAGLAAWCRAVTARRDPRALAAHTGTSSSMIRRWLGGQVRPTWPEFVLLVEGATGRGEDLLRELSPTNAESARSAARSRSDEGRRPAHVALWAARQLREVAGLGPPGPDPQSAPNAAPNAAPRTPPPRPALVEVDDTDEYTVETFGGDRTEPRVASAEEEGIGVAPLLHRVWCAISSDDYATLGPERPGWLAARTRLPEEVLQGCVDVLIHEGRISWNRDRHVVREAPTGTPPPEPPPDPAALLAARVEPIVLSLSREDRARVRALRRRTRAELAAIEATTGERQTLLLVVPDV